MVLIELTSHGIYSIINRINVTIVIVIMRAANKNNTRRLKLGGRTGHAGAGEGGDQRRHHRPPGAPPLLVSIASYVLFCTAPVFSFLSHTMY